MRHLRSDYDAIQPWPTKRPHIVKIDGEPVDIVKNQVETLGKHFDPVIPMDEPVFLLRASDPVGAATVHAWADYALAAGSDPALCERVHRWADEMEAYRVNLGRVRAADTPEGMLRP